MIVVKRVPRPRRFSGATGWFAVLLFTAIYLQKLGLTGNAAGVTLLGIVEYVTIIGLAFAGCLTISPLRLAIFMFFLAAALMSQMLLGRPVSYLSMIFLVFLYLPFVLICKVDQDEWLKITGLYQVLMLPIAFMVFIQAFSQAVLGLKSPSIENYIPSNLLMPGFLYEGHLHYGHSYIRPNGFFMVEPSAVSTYLAVAVIAEVAVFRRFWRAGVYAAAIIVSTGATGLVVLAGAAPVLFLKESRSVKAVLLGVLFAGAVVVLATGAGTSFFERVNELDVKNSSGSERLVAPLIEFAQVLQDPGHLLSGEGAGALSKADANVSAWPVVKLAYEYGLLTALLFMTLFVVAFIGAPIPAAAFGWFLIFNFTGGYLLTPIAPVFLFATVTSIRVRRAAVEPAYLPGRWRPARWQVPSAPV